MCRRGDILMRSGIRRIGPMELGMSEEPSKSQPNAQPPSDFARTAEDQAPGIIGEFVDWLKDNKKWWLLPVVVALLLVGALLVAGGSAAAPFIYTLF